MGVGGQPHDPASLPPRKTLTDFIGGWVVPRASLDGCGKSRPKTGFDPRTVQPIAQSLYRMSYPAIRVKVEETHLERFK